MNRTWSLAGLIWTFLRMAILLFASMVSSSAMVPGDILFLFAFSSGSFGMAALYLLLRQHHELWPVLKAPLLVGTLLGLLLVLVYTVLYVLEIASAGIALAGSGPTLLGLFAQSAVITLDGLFSFELYRRGR